VPAAAVIPAPIAYVNVVAVKKLVVGSRRVGGGSIFVGTAPFTRRFTLKKLECSKQALHA